MLCERGGYMLVDRWIPCFGFFQPVVVPNISNIEFRPLSGEESQPDVVNESPVETELKHELAACHDRRSRVAVLLHELRRGKMFGVNLVLKVTVCNRHALDA